MRARMLFLILSGALAVAGCDREPPGPARRVFGDERQEVRVRIGEEFGLRVSYNPTVAPDYRHELQEPLPSCLKLVTSDYESSDPHSRKTGVGGWKTCVLKGAEAGEARVVFACGAKSNAPDSVVFRVIVAP